MKYVIYYRVSTKKQGKSGLGLESQKAIINHFLKPDEIAATFTEVESGKLAERKELRKAIELCKEHGYTLAVAKIDRLSRKTETALSIFSELDGRLYSCDIPNLDKFTLTIFMAIADREGELISIRTKLALDERKKRNGEWRKSQLTNEGRKVSAQRRSKKAKEENAAIVDSICDKRKLGKSFGKIASELNSRGRKTSRGKSFSPMTVKRLYDRYCTCEA